MLQYTNCWETPLPVSLTTYLLVSESHNNLQISLLIAPFQFLGVKSKIVIVILPNRWQVGTDFYACDCEVHPRGNVASID